MIPTENWPKSWILQVHAAAVEQGFVWIAPITADDATSLTMRFYRVRRRSDKSMAAFIPAEYHLVTLGKWEPGPTGAGRLPVIYNRRVDGVPLPNIVPGDPAEISSYIPEPVRTDLRPVQPIELNPNHLPPSALEIKPDEIGDFVASLRQKAKERT